MCPEPIPTTQGRPPGTLGVNDNAIVQLSAHLRKRSGQVFGRPCKKHRLWRMSARGYPLCYGLFQASELIISKSQTWKL